jgi:DNA-binding NarL/FixJ family response regulator
MINIGIIEDNYFQLTSYKEFLEDYPECRVVFALRSLEEFWDQPWHEMNVDAVLLDIGLPGESGVQGVQDAIRYGGALCPRVAFQLISHINQDPLQAIRYKFPPNRNWFRGYVSITSEGRYGK